MFDSFQYFPEIKLTNHSPIVKTKQLEQKKMKHQCSNPMIDPCVNNLSITLINRKEKNIEINLKLVRWNIFIILMTNEPMEFWQIENHFSLNFLPL